MEYSDTQLLELVCESSEEAKDEIYKRYKYIIDIYLKKYYKISLVLKIDRSDLHQEALVGFADAINSYREEKEAGLATFISVCVERRIQGALLKANRLKSQIYNEAVSLDYIYNNTTTMKDILSDNNQNNPLEKMTRNESFEELVRKIKSDLSDKEYEVFCLTASGLNYREIALLLNKEPKQIDNTLTRIKTKIKKILVERN